MSIDLNKTTEAAQTSMVSLMKGAADRGLNVDDLTAQCVLVMDYSGSMEMDRRYSSGEVTAVATRTLAAALAGLDDDGSIPVHFFDTRVHPAVEVTAANHTTFVADFMRGKSMGGTAYMPPIETVLDGVRQPKRSIFRKAASGGPAAMPTLVFFVTDGAPRESEMPAIKRALADASGLPVFWQFIGLGYEPAFLRDLDTMSGRTVDNVGLTSVKRATDLDDGAWFTEMLREFITEWVPAARAAGIIA